MDTTKKTLVVHDGVVAGGWQLASALTNVALTGSLVWVDAVNGNDSKGQRGQVQLPFLTLTAAKNAAVSGDTIMVLPGTYNEKNLAKNGVNWHFFNGAIISYAGTATGGIFDTTTAGVACTFRVSGFGVFKVTSESSPQTVVKSGYSTDSLKMEFDRIEGLGACFDVQGTVFVRCNELKTTSANCVYCNGTSALLNIYCHKISTAGGNAVEIVSGTAEIVARYISSSGGKGLRFTGGTLLVTAYEISSSVNYAIECNCASGTCRVHDARIVSTLATSSGIAVYITAGSGYLRFANCSFVSNAAASYSISTGGGAIVYLYTPCVANLSPSGSVTLTGTTLTVNSALT